MAHKDVTRLGKLNQKRNSSYFVVRIDAENMADFASGANKVMQLPANSVTIDAFAFIKTLPASPYVIKLGVSEGGSELMFTGTPAAVGKIGTVPSQKHYDVPTDVYLDLASAPVDGDLFVVLEYLELDNTNGEMTVKSPI